MMCQLRGRMQSIQTPNNKTNDDVFTPTDDELHALAVQYICESNQLIFQDLPKVITQIEYCRWLSKPPLVISQAPR